MILMKEKNLLTENVNKIVAEKERIVVETTWLKNELLTNNKKWCEEKNELLKKEKELNEEKIWGKPLSRSQIK